MYPSALVSSHDIDSDADDADMMMHLKSIEHGDAHPGNVITDVNPQTVAPENLPPKTLFLCKLEEGVEAPQGGYWQLMRQDPIILENSPTVGQRTTLKFHTGQAPNGDITDWVMHAYRMEPNGSSSLCRVFLNDGQNLNNVELEPHDQDGTSMDVGLILMNWLEAEENEHTNSSQVVSRKEHGQPDVSSNHLHDLGHHSIQYPPEDYDVLTGNYLELNDLLSPSSISESTCIASMTSDEYFNSGGLMFDSETGNTIASVPNMEQRHADCRFNVSAPQGSHQMVIQPPSGSLHSNNNPQIKETMASATMPKRLRVPDAPLSITTLDQQTNLKAPNHGPKVNMANEGTSNRRGGTSHHSRGERKIAARMAKLRRKYCCFFPI